VFDVPLEASTRPTLQHLAPAGRGLPVAVLLVIVVLGVAVLKPWVPSAPGIQTVESATASTGPRIATPATAPTPSSTPVPAPPRDAARCHNRAAWRLVVVERGPRREQRTWFAMKTLASASGPTDAAIPFRRTVSDDAVAIGFCAPDVDAGLDSSGGILRASGARIWRIRDGAATEVTGLQRIGSPAYGFAELYRPSRAGERVWTSAGYVFAVRDPFGRELWFGLRVAARQRP